MKAVVYEGPKNIRVKEVSEPKILEESRKVLVKFKVGSICGTDLHLYRGEWKIKQGRIIGHDACGVREDTGERVVMVPSTYCGKCFFCIRGRPELCENIRFFGLTKNGFFAETLALNPKNLVPIPESLSDEEAAIMEPIALALHTFSLLKPDAGDWATIIGQGPIGLLMLQVAKLSGCKTIAIDIEAYRLKVAERYGADYCINAQEENAVESVQQITRLGSDVVVEAAGTHRTVEQTPFMVRKAGRVALVGEFKGRMNFEEADEALFFTTYTSPIRYPRAVELLTAKKIDVKELITHKFKLAEFEKAIQTANSPVEKPLKVVITG